MCNYVVENEKDFVISLPLNGVKKEEISVKIEKDTLFIQAVKKIDVDPTFKVLHEEFDTEQEIKLSFSLGDDVDQNHIDAKMDKGVLTLTLQKKEEALPKKIQIA